MLCAFRRLLFTDDRQLSLQKKKRRPQNFRADASFSPCRHLRGISNTIHRNMCLSLLTAEILVLIGMKKEDTDKVSCIVVAFFLHFLLLSAFGWMALEGCHIIVLLWKVFNEGRTYYEGYYLAGYGIPLVIASITLGCQFDSYCKKDGTYCWLPSEKGIRYSFIGPVAAVIIITLGALPLVLWKKSQTRLQTERSTVEKVQHWLWRTFILLPILGVTWLLGFIMLASSDLHMAGAYLFTIFNSFQGLGMLLCYVLLKKKTRQEILRTVATITSIRKNSMSSQSSGSNPTSVTNTSRTTSSPSNPNSSWHTQQERELPLQTFDAEGKVGSSRPRKRWYKLGTCE